MPPSNRSPGDTDSDLRHIGALLQAAIAAAGPDGRTTVDRHVLAAAARIVETHEALAASFTERVADVRLEALRELAYGAGHEINNPLANIAARAQALLLDEREPERRRRLATIVDQAFRARDMIGGLMVFARPPRPEPAATTLEALVAPLLATFQPQAETRRVELVCRGIPPLVELSLDASQVGEALRLLTMNAFEAVPEGGRVEIAARQDPTDTHAEIEIVDDGSGMDPETAERACDPFFSGREAGRGIGLGLPKALRLIEANGGRLRIASRPGHGTRCRVSLPLATAGH